MTFQAYIENIEAKTGKTPDDFNRQAKDAGLVGPGVKATQQTDWLKAEFDLGHGHAMAIWAVFKRNGWVEAPAKSKAGG